MISSLGRSRTASARHEEGDGGEFHLLDRPGQVRRQRRCWAQSRVARATVTGYRLGNTCPALPVPEKVAWGTWMYLLLLLVGVVLAAAGVAMMRYAVPI